MTGTGGGRRRLPVGWMCDDVWGVTVGCGLWWLDMVEGGWWLLV